MKSASQQVVEQIDGLLSLCRSVEGSWKYERTIGGWFEDQAAFENLMTQILALIEHVYGRGHTNHQRIIAAYNEQSKKGLIQAKGLLQGTRANVESGLLSGFETRVRIEITSDFLAAAKEMIDGGDKDPASVLAVCVLEDSLKQIARSRQLPELAGKEISLVINGLASKGIIERSTQNALLSFRQLRNAAFHANWEEVTADGVNMLISFLPSFIERYRP